MTPGAGAAPPATADLFELEATGPDEFIGWCHEGGPLKAFGGQLAGQALRAALHTLPDDRGAHSLHSYFLRAADVRQPITYSVTRLRDGRGYSSRAVQATQDGTVVFTLTASFHSRTTDVPPSLDRQAPFPQVPSPDEVATLPSPRGPGGLVVADPVLEMLELRFVHDPWHGHSGPHGPTQCFWVRSRHPLPEDRAVHDCTLAYLSDVNLARTAQHPHRSGGRDLLVASLDHSLWLHRPVRADQWLLFVQESTNAVVERGLTHGRLYAEDGTLVASTTQESLLRPQP